MSGLVASMIGRSALHSQRTQTSDRSPLVPRSSIQRSRRQARRSRCGRSNTSRCRRYAPCGRPARNGPARPAAAFWLWSTNLPFDSEGRGISRRERVERPDSVARAPWVMNHSGNCQQVMPVFWVEVGSSLSGGGAYSARLGNLEQVLELGDQPRLEDLVPLGPVFEAADDDRMVRQVEHRARPERRHHLALPDLAVRLLVPGPGGAHACSSFRSRRCPSSAARD